VHAALRLGHAEVEEPGHAVGADDDVLRRDVTVHDAHALVAGAGAVRAIQPAQRVADDGRDDGQRQRAAALRRAALHPGQRLAGDVLEDLEEVALVLEDVERGDHVGVTDARRDARLVEEHGDEGRLRGQLGPELLDGQEPPRGGPAHRASDVHGGHPAIGEATVHLVQPVCAPQESRPPHSCSLHPGSASAEKARPGSILHHARPRTRFP
jgi:hypothetical protein